MRKLSLFLILILSFTNLISKEVSRDVAIKSAIFIYQERHSLINQPLVEEPKILSVYEDVVDNKVLYYVINFDDNGFVIIAGDDASEPVIAYSLESNFDKSNASPSLKEWFGIYETQLQYIIKTNAKPTIEIETEWNRISNSNASFKTLKSTDVIVSPLLTTTWNQNIYYNELCPFDTNSPSGYDNHVPNGCVALATAQIMYFHRHPESGVGSYSYFHNDYGTQSANFSTANYDWNSMSDVVTYYNNNVAKLIYHVGVSVEMNYGADGSGAMTEDAGNALENNFKYHSSISTKSKWNYTETNWITLLKQNIDVNRPLIYAARSNEGGHAFNCDGYDETNKFHFNWGWGGSDNGYFLVTNMNPSSSLYNQDHRAIVNIYPATTPTVCQSNVTLTAINGSLEDGSRSLDYANNLDCTWLLAPENAASITINFARLNTEANNDSIIFYSGENTSSPIYKSFSGSTLPESFTINSSKVLVRFKSNSTVTSGGWLFNYSSYPLVSYCSFAKILNGLSGSFSDGSDDNKYNNNTNCKWIINATGANSMNLNFTSFNLSDEDEVYVYRRSSSKLLLLGEYTGSTIPSSIYCSSPYLTLLFISDNKNTGQGWDANWSSSSDINEINGLSSVVLFPNPATNYLKVQIQIEKTFIGEMNIYNSNGQLVFVKNISANEGVFEDQINIENFPSGLYLICLKNREGQINMKFSKQ